MLQMCAGSAAKPAGDHEEGVGGGPAPDGRHALQSSPPQPQSSPPCWLERKRVRASDFCVIAAPQSCPELRCHAITVSLPRGRPSVPLQLLNARVITIRLNERRGSLGSAKHQLRARAAACPTLAAIDASSGGGLPHLRFSTALFAVAGERRATRYHPCTDPSVVGSGQPKVG